MPSGILKRLDGASGGLGSTPMGTKVDSPASLGAQAASTVSKEAGVGKFLWLRCHAWVNTEILETSCSFIMRIFRSPFIRWRYTEGHRLQMTTLSTMQAPQSLLSQETTLALWFGVGGEDDEGRWIVSVVLNYGFRFSPCGNWLYVSLTGPWGAQTMLFLVVSVRLFLDSISIWIRRLSKADCPFPCGWASSNQLKTCYNMNVQQEGTPPAQLPRWGRVLSRFGLGLKHQLPLSLEPAGFGTKTRTTGVPYSQASQLLYIHSLIGSISIVLQELV